MSSEQKCAIVIVNWNSGIQLKACLNSIDSSDVGRSQKVVVVDNGSTDGSDADLETLPNLEVIHAGINLGFSAACNLGAGKTKSEYILFLNPDAKLEEDTLLRAFAFMDQPSQSKVAICGVKLINEIGDIARSCSRLPTTASMFWYTVGLDRVFPQLGFLMTDWNHQCSQHVDHVIGAFFMVRRQVFLELGGFDERFFLYFEDLDFSLRAKHAGFVSYYLAEARAFHAGGGTSRQIKSRRLFYSLRSRWLYACKHLPTSGVFLVFVAMLAIEPWVRIVASVWRKSFEDIRETWQAYCMLLFWIFSRIFSGKER